MKGLYKAIGAGLLALTSGCADKTMQNLEEQRKYNSLESTETRIQYIDDAVTGIKKDGVISSNEYATLATQKERLTEIKKSLEGVQDAATREAFTKHANALEQSIESYTSEVMSKALVGVILVTQAKDKSVRIRGARQGSYIDIGQVHNELVADFGVNSEEARAKLQYEEMKVGVEAGDALVVPGNPIATEKRINEWLGQHAVRIQSDKDTMTAFLAKYAKEGIGDKANSLSYLSPKEIDGMLANGEVKEIYVHFGYEVKDPAAKADAPASGSDKVTELENRIKELEQEVKNSKSKPVEPEAAKEPVDPDPK